MPAEVLYTDRISAAWAQQTSIEEARTPNQPGDTMQNVWASQWRKCDRAMCLDLIHPEDRGEWNVTSLERFARGKAIESMLISKLLLAGCHGGFTVQAQQKRYEIKGRDGRVVITGNTDGNIVFNDEHHNPIPFDVKSGQAVQHCETSLDLFGGRWTRHMPYQLLAYMLGEGVPRGMIIVDKPTGPAFIPITILDHLQEAEAFLRSAERACAVRDAVVAGRPAKLPDFIGLPEECLSCDHYKKSCHPPMASGEGMTFIDDPEILELAQQRAANEEAGKLFATADKKLKAKLRGVTLGSIAGEFDVVGKWGTSKKTRYPEACLSCGEPITSFCDEDPQGRFTVTITPAGKSE